MINHLLETLGFVTIEILRRSKIAKAVFIAAAVALMGASGALIYAATVGHTFVSGREVKMIDVLPALLASGITSLVILVFVAFSLIDPERIKEFTKRNSDEDHLLNYFADNMLAPIGVTVARSGRRDAYVGKRVGKTVIGPPEKEETAVDEDIIKGIRGNLGHLLEYYKMNKSQARNSFNASLWSIVAGFVTLIVGAVWAYTAERNDLTAYLVPFAGVILQVIGGGYFYMYNRSLIQLNFFFSRLAQMQDTLLAIHLSEAMPDGDDKNRALERLIFVIAERSTTAPAYLSEAYGKKKIQAAQ